MIQRMKWLAVPMALALAVPVAAQCSTTPRPRPRPPVNTGPGDTTDQGRPSSPASGSPARPSAGPSSPSGRPSRPQSGPPRAPRSPRSGGSGSPASPSGDAISDPDSWRFWWRYNRNAYLDLRRSLAENTVTGSDDFFLGRGEDSDGRVAPLNDRVHGEVAPSLASLLEGETDPGVVASTLLALAKFGDRSDRATDDPSVVDRIRPFLADGHGLVAEMAVIALGLTRSQAALGTLGHLALDDERGRELRGGKVSERMRSFAAYGIALIGQETERVDIRRFAVQKLARAWDVSNEAQPDLRVAALLGLGLMPLAPTGRAIEGEPVPSRGLEDQLEWTLAQFDGDASMWVRAHVPTTLARLLTGATDAELRERCIDRMVRAIGPRSSESREIRMSCAQALGQIADADGDALDVRIRKALSATVDDDADRQVRAFALMSLAQCGARRGDAAGDAWAAVGDVREELSRELVRGKRFLRPWAALALGVLERGLQDASGPISEETGDALRAVLEQERSPELVGALCIGLGIIRDPQSAGALLGAFERADPETRAYATVALGMIDARGALEDLERALEDSKYQPRLVWSTAVAMAMMRDSDVVTQLVGLLEKSQSSITRSGVCFALGHVGDASAVTALLRTSRDGKVPDGSRALAIEALGIVGEKGDLPWNTTLSANTNYRAAPPTLSGIDTAGVLDLF